MSIPTNFIRLTPPTLAAGFCPTGPTALQQLANAIIGGTRATILLEVGTIFYNLGDSTPLPENRGFPWIHTGNGLLWLFRDGVWTTPRPLVDASFRWMWKPANGTPESALWAIDGGDGTDPASFPPTSITGAMWEVDHEMDDRFPLGASSTYAIGATGGAIEHTLTEEEGGNGVHTHAFGLTNQAGGGSSDDAFFAMGTLGTVTGYNGFYITGSNGRIVTNQTQADLRTLPSGVDGLGVPDPDPFSIMPPYRAVWWAKPTSRIYRTLPA